MSRVLHNSIPLAALLTPVVAALTLSGCGLITGSNEFLAQVDSVTVQAPLANSSSAALTFFGYVGANGCVDLKRVDKRVVADTLTWRFVSRSRGGSCTQMPVTLRYVDSIPSQPARTVHIKVEQRAAPLTRAVTLPLGTAR
ncbi:hypothetical protein [Gemmatimonas sp.]